MTHRAVVEDRNIPLIIIARILSLGIAPLALLHGWTIASSGRLIEGVVLAAIGVFASVCLFAVLSVLSALSELARVNRYRRGRCRWDVGRGAATGVPAAGLGHRRQVG